MKYASYLEFNMTPMRFNKRHTQITVVFTKLLIDKCYALLSHTDIINDFTTGVVVGAGQATLLNHLVSHLVLW